MSKHSDTLLIVACVVVGLALLSVHNAHPGFSPAGWAGSYGRSSVSLTFVAQMAELQLRRFASAVGAVVSIR